MERLSEAPASFAFGRFKIIPQRRAVRDDGRPVQLGGRAFDVFVALVEASGTLVSKDELMSRVWPGGTIEENTADLRMAKALLDSSR